MKLGGYFINLSTARKVAKHLNIDVGEDTFFNNRHMEWPINNWLHDNGMLHIKTGFIKWPLKDGEYGVFFISRFRQVHDPAPDDFIEGEKDLEVRKWLMDLNAEGIQWVSIIDRYGITLDGIQPRFSDVKFGHSTGEEILERVAKMKREQAGLDLERARVQGEELEKREKEGKEREEEAKRLVDESKQAALDAKKREFEANARVLETEARKAADEVRKREDQVQKDLQQTNVEKKIQPEIWPTEEDSQFAKNRVQYDSEKIHIAVCGSSGSGKSSLVNAFRGLKNGSRQAAPTGVVETTMDITRYPDSRKELPYKRLVWFDCPGAGRLEIPGLQYFNQQGLYIFDIIILVYDSRLTQIDVSIIKNCERFKIPLFIVRSKADLHIKNIMHDIGYDEIDDYADDDFDGYQRRARQLLIDVTRKDLEDKLEMAELNKHDVFLVSPSVIFSLVTAKEHKKTTPAIDETRLMETMFRIELRRLPKTM